MPRLILVKHSLPEIVRGAPARQWPLSAEGRLRSHALVERLNAYAPQGIVSSTEPKAVETAQIVAAAFNLPCQAVEGLHEHDRSDVGWLSAEQLDAAVADFFARPNELAFGRETADQAHARFSQAVAGVIERHGGQTTVVVAHGTVITLYVSRLAGLEPFPFWKRLGLPSFVVLSLPDLKLLDVIGNVEANRGT